jgi:hypothetical protein
MMLVESALQLSESLLRSRQVSRLEGLTDGCEVLLALFGYEGVPAGERAALAQSLDGSEFLLGPGKVSGLEGFTKLLQIGASLLIKRLHFLVNGTCGNSRCRHESLLVTDAR